jgi:2-aminoadipate transaminase
MPVNWEQVYAERARAMRASEIRELLKLMEQPDLISFAGGMPDPSLFSRREFAEVTAYVLEEKAARALQYGQTEGVLCLRELLVEKMRGEGITLDLDNLTIITASQQGLDLIGKVLVDPGDVVLVEAPTYLGALQAFKTFQGRVLGIPLDDDGLRIDLLEEKLQELHHQNIRPKFLYTIPNFQNPAGVTLSLERRRRLLAVASEYDLLIVEDDPYGYIRFSGEPLPSLKALDSEGRVITLRSFSKILAPGIRLGWMIGDAAFIRKVVIAKQSADACSPPFTQYIAYEFCRRGYLQPYIERVREAYRQKCECMLTCLEEFFPPEMRWTRPQGGFFVWATAPETVDTVELLPRVIAAKVAYVVGSAFFPDGSGRNTMRLNFSLPSLADICVGIQRLGCLLQEEIQHQERVPVKVAA